MENLQVFTTSNIAVFLAVVVGLAGMVILAANVVDAVRKLRRPSEREQETLATRQLACDKKFQNDKQRLDAHERVLEDVCQGQRVQCVAVKALLNHAIHNGNTNEMVEAADGLDKWLINRK